MRHLDRAMVFVILCSLLVGCSARDDLATVTGHISLDGNPLEGAIIEFQPLAKHGSPSAGITDANGRYELMHTFRTSGAMLGEHRVTIRTASAFYEDEEAGSVPVERIPARYNVDSQLRRTVEAASNVIDFQLSSDPTSATSP